MISAPPKCGGRTAPTAASSATGPRTAEGRFLLFESPDGFVWHYKKVLAANRNRFGKMWECPDFFPLDGK